MANFPILQENQVALVNIEYQTGIVYNFHFKYARGSDEIHIIFNNIDEALEYAKENISNNSNLECAIFDFNEKLLYNLDKTNICTI